MRGSVLAISLLLLGPACAPREQAVTRPASSQPSAAKPDRWEAEIRKFVEADRESPPPRGAVLFIGSSSIRLWKDVAADFPDVHVINRGFGGSRIPDSTRYIDQIVAPYRPRVIVLYAGDNDLAGGHAPKRVFEDYVEFVQQVRRRLPNVRIAFISIKPSPARMVHFEAARQANELIRQYAAKHRGLVYIDVFTPMLGPDGKPRPELFVRDKLHMNRQGYDLWKAAVAPFLK